MKDIFEIVKAFDLVEVNSQKDPSGKVSKRTVVVKAVGGKFADSLVVNLLGNSAQAATKEGELVFAKLGFSAREYNGQYYQDVYAQAWLPLNT